MKTASRRLLLCLTLAALAGCGSADPGAVGYFDPVRDLEGTFWISSVGGDDGPPHQMFASWGTVESDGLGMLLGTGMTTENVQGVVTGPAPTLAQPYDVDHLGGLSVGADLALPDHRGGLADDGSVACLASVRSGLAPEIRVLGKKHTGLSAAEVAGLHHVFGFWGLRAGTQRAAVWGTMNLDALGNTVRDVMWNENGTLINFVGLTSTLAATDDGCVSGTIFPPLTGALVGDGELMVFGGGTLEPTIPALYVLVRSSTEASAATFSGTYWAVNLTATGTTSYQAALTTVDADGVGGLTLGAAIVNQDGAVSSLPAGGGNVYTVAPDGGLSVGGGFLRGAVSASGRYAVLAGSTVGGEDPTFWFLVR